MGSWSPQKLFLSIGRLSRCRLYLGIDIHVSVFLRLCFKVILCSLSVISVLKHFMVSVSAGMGYWIMVALGNYFGLLSVCPRADQSLVQSSTSLSSLLSLSRHFLPLFTNSVPKCFLISGITGKDRGSSGGCVLGAPIMFTEGAISTYSLCSISLVVKSCGLHALPLSVSLFAI